MKEKTMHNYAVMFLDNNGYVLGFGEILCMEEYKPGDVVTTKFNQRIMIDFEL